MAKNTSVENQVAAPQIPQGFRRVGSVSDAGWFNQSKIGNVCHGTLEGLFQRKDALNPEGESEFFQIQLLAPCEVRMGKGEDAKLTMAQAGDFVNLNMGPKTKPLKNYVASLIQGAAYEVYVVVKGAKVKLSGGRSMHNIEVAINQTASVREDAEPDFDGSTDSSV